MRGKVKNLPNLVKQLSRLINEVRDGSRQNEVNEEWTKIVLILPLLEALGWDRTTDIMYEQSLFDDEERSGLILRCEPPIVVETRRLDEFPSKDFENDYIEERRLSMWKGEAASYFIWTNGDRWCFFSLVLPKAPPYEVILSQADDVRSVTEKLSIIKKEFIADNVEIFDRSIRDNWKTLALTNAWEELPHKNKENFIQLIRQDLPIELDIEDEEILAFLEKSKLDHSSRTIPETTNRNIMPEPRWPLADDHPLSSRRYTKDKPIDIVRDLKTVYEKHLIFIQVGFFWEVYDEDADTCSRLFGWKVVPFSLESVFTGTPTNSYRFKERLEDEGISYIMVAQNEYPASHPLGTRRVIEFFESIDA